MNNLLRCDLSVGQLEALAESKGKWWLVEDDYSDSDAILIKEWNGFKFYFVSDDYFWDYCPPLYCVTPEGYFLSSDPISCDETEEESNSKESELSKQIKWAEGFVEDAIATLLNFPATQGQLSLLELINV